MYTVKILSEEDFNKLPYKRAKTSLGLADPKTNVAYIRDTGYNDITKATIAHELDELVAKVSPHEEDGIRYKDLGGFASSIGKGFKSIASPVASTLGAVAKAPFQLAGSAINAFKPSNINTPGGAFNKATSALKSFGGNVLNSFTGEGTPASAFQQGSPDSFAAPPFAGKSPAVFPIENVTASSPVQSKSVLDSFGSQIGDALKDFAGPAAVSSLGNLFAPKVESPDFSSITNRLENRISQGGDPELRSVAKNALVEGITGDPSNVPEGAFLRADQVADDLLERDLEALRQQFKAANPRSNIENNSRFLELEREVRERDRERRIGLRQQVEFEFLREELGRRQEDIRLALGLDESQMRQLVELANLDVAEIMARIGISQGEAAQIKQLFGNFGQTLLEKNLEA